MIKPKQKFYERPGLWKILLAVALGFAFLAFLLGWIGFGVPDWQAFTRNNGTTQEFYGLWAYCQQAPPFYSTVCKHWGTAATQIYNGSRPNFISTADGLMTTGMILLSLGLITGIVAAILPLLCYVAGILTFLGFLMIIIGLPIFGEQSNSLSKLQGITNYYKRYGFWLMVPTIIFSFIAAILFIIAAFLYQRYGFGNIATHSYSRRPQGGQQNLAPPNMIPGIPPYGVRPGMMPYPYPPPGPLAPSLLSQYIAQRMPRYYGPTVVRPVVVSAFPQPSTSGAGGQPVYVTPAYYRPAAVRSAYAPTVNLTGRAVYAPTVRVS
ncbi:unnamed protein product [Rotaria sp. Silwood1]|nr:unnamed protein product [Rotaria sp. Silwood1]CAF1616520.1 unnamed protein product [Rotaria sp. Silwood1]CAF3699739.1 unnamed protein product [Rotaria sp. Silwood1]CAF3729747.1 unnamed protein product [Rotaria sp. Silwood1]CAF3807649.1 unnamed protein product [Rotaria sp. Silwood1]